MGSCTARAGTGEALHVDIAALRKAQGSMPSIRFEVLLAASETPAERKREYGRLPRDGARGD